MSKEKLTIQKMFRDIPEQKLQEIFDTGNTFNVSSGYVLIEEGQLPRHIYFVISGEVEVIVPDPESEKDKQLTTLGAGECVGEYGFIDGRPASATVRAVETSQVFAITIPLFKKLLEQDSDFERVVYRNLLSTLVERLRTSNVIIDFLQYQQQEITKSDGLH